MQSRGMCVKRLNHLHVDLESLRALEVLLRLRLTFRARHLGAYHTAGDPGDGGDDGGGDSGR